MPHFDPMTNLGVIGLGVMGRNIVLNLVDHGFEVSIFNRTSWKTEKLESESDKIVGFYNLKEFVDSLTRPKKILLIVTAGNAVEEYLTELQSLLSEEDIVIDSGNTYYMDTIKRYNQYSFNFVGCGVSGGEYGARFGPAMFFGCKKEVYNSIKDIFETISAKYDQKPCCMWMGDDGAGHFVKMIHNGIEYVEMQLLQEITNILFAVCNNIEDSWVLKVFDELNKGFSSSYLVEICGKIIRTKNENGTVLNQILDQAEQKGTGKMCIYSGVETDTVISTFTESVFARYLSSQKSRRVAFSSLVKENMEVNSKVFGNLKTENSISLYKNAFYLCKAIGYIQGCDILISNKKKHKWSYTIPEICDTWRNGCILRSEFLNELKKMALVENLETSDTFQDIFKDTIGSLKSLCSFIIENEIYCPVFLGCYSWISGLKQSKNNGVLIQAMRDYFGRHTVILESSGERKSIDWLE